MPVRFTWRGEQVKKKIREASKKGLDKTGADCVTTAKIRPRMPFMFGFLQGSMQMRPAEERDNKIVMLWGSFEIEYALYQELRKGFMRHAMDQHYGELVQNIKRYL